jgi:hypothetical protein
MDQLRLVMQQKKERREARKLKVSPYNGKVTVPPCGSPTIQVTPKFNDNSTNSMNSISASSAGSSTTATAINDLNHLAEEVDTAA